MAEEKKEAVEEAKAPEEMTEASPKAAEAKAVENKAAEAKKPEEKKVSEEPKKAPKPKKQDQSRDEPVNAKSKSTANVDGASPAQVVKVFKKAGLYGECYQVLARVLEGRDKGNLLRRNVRGPVKENDMLMLKETERDVRAV